MDRTEQLRRVELFSSLKDRALERVASIAHEESYPTGTNIFQHGDVGDKVYLILDGKVRIARQVPGIGEEALFRGLVQGYLEARMGPGTALLLASALFGLVHPLTRAYVVLAAIFGCYLGWLWLITENLMAPVVAHGLYDFLALRTLVQRHRQSARIGSDPQTDPVSPMQGD